MDNRAEGNLYVRMKGGYLRVMYPEPEVCLNLPAWKEFCGFDLTGQNGWFDVEVDRDGAIHIRDSADAPRGLPDQLKRLALIRRPGDVAPVAAPPESPADMNGAARGESALPGPLATWD